MTTQRGFTILEMIMAMVLVGLLVAGIMFAYLTCFRAFNSGQDRIIIRTKLSQAMDLMGRELYNAQSITSCSSTSLTFTANLGSGLAAYTFALSGSNLVTDGGVTRATGIQTPGGSIPNIFTCTNGLVTIDMTAVQNGASVRLQNNIMPRNMPTGLVGWWQFDEGSGSLTLDSSGNSNTGAITGATYVSGKIGPYALNFNSTTNYVSIADSSALRLASGGSISAWIYPTGFGESGKGRIVDKSTSTTAGNGYCFFVDNANVTSGLSSFVNGNACLEIANVITLNAWQFVVWTFGTSSYLYVNGSQVGGPVSCTPPNVSGSVTIGEYTGLASQRYFQGTIDDVRIYNRALSASEIVQLYNAGIGN